MGTPAERVGIAVAGMTGVGLARGMTELGELAIEVRSVNGKTTSVKVRLPGSLTGLEAAIEQQVKGFVRRGQVLVTIEQVDARATTGAGVVDPAHAARAAAALHSLAQELRLGAPTLSDVLAVPGVLPGLAVAPRVSWELPPLTLALLQQALRRLAEHRRTEGQATLLALTALLDQLVDERAAAAARAPLVIDHYRQRLLERVQTALNGHHRSLADDDVIREVALFADRADVSEELQRLEAHLTQAQELLAQGGEVGRRLEFLAQELLREVNTLGAKSPDVAMSRAVLAAKAAIEKIKEQAANLE